MHIDAAQAAHALQGRAEVGDIRRRIAVSRYAVNIVERLQSAGYQAYLVGGCVRDMLLDAGADVFGAAAGGVAA